MSTQEQGPFSRHQSLGHLFEKHPSSQLENHRQSFQFSEDHIARVKGLVIKDDKPLVRPEDIDREVIRRKSSVNALLSKGRVRTSIRPEDGHVPISQQANLLFYTDESVKRRQMIRSDELVVAVITSIFNEWKTESVNALRKNNYVKMCIWMGEFLTPEEDNDARTAQAEFDWKQDSKGLETMSFELFFDAFFELVDLWCPTMDVKDYLVFLRDVQGRLKARAERERRREKAQERKLKAMTKMSIVRSLMNGKKSDPEKQDKENDKSAVPAPSAPAKPKSMISAPRRSKLVQKKNEEEQVATEPPPEAKPALPAPEPPLQRDRSFELIPATGPAIGRWDRAPSPPSSSFFDQCSVRRSSVRTRTSSSSDASGGEVGTEESSAARGGSADASARAPRPVQPEPSAEDLDVLHKMMEIQKARSGADVDSVVGMIGTNFKPTKKANPMNASKGRQMQQGKDHEQHKMNALTEGSVSRDGSSLSGVLEAGSGRSPDGKQIHAESSKLESEPSVASTKPFKAVERQIEQFGVGGGRFKGVKKARAGAKKHAKEAARAAKKEGADNEDGPDAEKGDGAATDTGDGSRSRLNPRVPPMMYGSQEGSSIKWRKHSHISKRTSAVSASCKSMRMEIDDQVSFNVFGTFDDASSQGMPRIKGAEPSPRANGSRNELFMPRAPDAALYGRDGFGSNLGFMTERTGHRDRGGIAQSILVEAEHHQRLMTAGGVPGGLLSPRYEPTALEPEPPMSFHSRTIGLSSASWLLKQFNRQGWKLPVARGATNAIKPVSPAASLKASF